METGTLNSKLVVIRGYLEKNLPHCVIQESARPETDFQLTVTYGEMGLCTLRVHAALLFGSSAQCGGAAVGLEGEGHCRPGALEPSGVARP